MTAHDHTTRVPGCFRCDLSADEVEHRDEWGRRVGWCNACGEEALLDDLCCEDGEVVPYDDDPEDP